MTRQLPNPFDADFLEACNREALALAQVTESRHCGIVVRTSPFIQPDAVVCTPSGRIDDPRAVVYRVRTNPGTPGCGA